MTALAVPPGLTIDQARNRLRGEGLWLPRLGVDGVSTSGRVNVTLAASATPNVPGAWTQMIATTTEDIAMVKIDVQSSGANLADSSTLYDLGVGGAGSEVVVIPDIPVGYTSLTNGSVPPGLYFPIFIPKGSRISLRKRSSTASTTLLTRLHVWAVNPLLGGRPSSTVTSLGAVTASSRGTILATTVTPNTKTAWTQIVAATVEEYVAIATAVQGASSTNEGSTTNVALDIGVGPAGSEVVIVPDLFCLLNTNEQVHIVSPNLNPCRIPAGTRIAARWAGNNPSATTTLDVLLHGIRRLAA